VGKHNPSTNSAKDGPDDVHRCTGWDRTHNKPHANHWQQQQRTLCCDPGPAELFHCGFSAALTDTVAAGFGYTTAGFGLGVSLWPVIALLGNKSQVFSKIHIPLTAVALRLITFGLVTNQVLLPNRIHTDSYLNSYWGRERKKERKQKVKQLILKICISQSEPRRWLTTVRQQKSEHREVLNQGKKTEHNASNLLS